MKLTPIILIAACLFLSPVLSPGAEPAVDFAARCADRAAIERVYHSHRTGTKQTFDEAMPRALLEQIVRQDQHKEAVLRKAYGVEITPAMLAAEVQRINTTTRAPEVLAEIKHALGDDAARFAAAMARPIIVERDLDPELQKVPRVQLQKPGDVSAVIEMPGGFLIFLAKSKNAETLTAAALSIPNRSYEDWLAQQPAANP